jgi:hypothetical protein
MHLWSLTLQRSSLDCCVCAMLPTLLCLRMCLAGVMAQAMYNVGYDSVATRAQLYMQGSGVSACFFNKVFVQGEQAQALHPLTCWWRRR